MLGSSLAISDRRGKPALFNGATVALDFVNGRFRAPTTNKCTNTNVNPQSLTNISSSSGMLSIVEDSAELAKIGLTGNAYKLDNSAGGTTIHANIGGTVGNLNPHTWSIYARGSGSMSLRYTTANLLGGTMTLTENYVRYDRSRTPAATNENMIVSAQPGAVVYFILNQLEEGQNATQPVVVNGAAATRADTSGWAALSNISGLTVSRASVGYAEKADGTVVEFAPNTARITDKGLLIEEARTNTVVHSLGLTGNPFAIVGGTGVITYSVVAGVAPDGGAQVARLQITSGATFRAGSTTGGTMGVTYAGSVYMRSRDGRTLTFTIDVNDTGTKVVQVGPEWTRISTTGSRADFPYRFLDIASATPNGDIDIEIWGAQVEAGDFPTSVIPTTSASATRAADAFFLNGFSLSGALSMFAEQDAIPMGSAGFPRMASLGLVGDSSLYFDLYRDISLGASVRVQGATPTTATTASSVASYDVVRAVAASTGSTLRISAGGGAVGTVSLALTPTFNRLHIGNRTAMDRPANTYIRRVVLYPYALNDNQLQAVAA